MIEDKDGNVKGHRFEAILGLTAPFSLIGFEKRSSFDPLQKGSGGTCCDYCRTYIVNVYWIQDAAGKKFKVGSECVRHTNDQKLITLVESEKKKQARIQRQEKAMAKHAAEKIEYDAIAPVLAKYPHPHPYFASIGKTLKDYYDFTGNKKAAIADAKAKTTEAAK